jgi:hypothetical protein
MERASRATWKGRVRGWKHSGLTADAYAQREGFNANTLKWWSCQLGRVESAPLPPVVEVQMSSASEGELEVVLGNGARLVVPVGFDEGTLRRLLVVLEGR